MLIYYKRINYSHIMEMKLFKILTLYIEKAE